MMLVLILLFCILSMAGLTGGIIYALDKVKVQEGAYSFDKINEMLANGQINSETLLWYDGLAAWIPLSQLQNQASTSPASTN